jgi:hypothetical protein
MIVIRLICVSLLLLVPVSAQLDLYYLRQNDGVSVPGDLNVIGTTLRFRL